MPKAEAFWKPLAEANMPTAVAPMPPATEDRPMAIEPRPWVWLRTPIAMPETPSDELFEPMATLLTAVAWAFSP